MARQNSWETRGSPYLQVTGTRVKCVAAGIGTCTLAAHSMPSEQLQYFEVDIVAQGSNGKIGIGLATSAVALDRMPGWDPCAYGYHGDDGKVFHASGSGRFYGPQFGTGDWVGVVFNKREGNISFIRNGVDLGVAFRGVPEEGLRPIVGFGSFGAEVDVNFGEDPERRPFKADVAALLHKALHSAPSAWDPGGSAYAMQRLEAVGTRVAYTGTGPRTCIRSDHPVPASCPVYYWEADIVNSGSNAKVGIGLATRHVPLHRMPGWEPHAYGYHGDDGKVFAASGHGKPYGPCFGTGDWVGVVYDQVAGTISFIRNGVDLGVAFRGVAERQPLFPIVGFGSPGAEVEANFGGPSARPFRWDVGALRRQSAQQLRSRVLQTPLPAEPRDLLDQLIFDHLCHQGYWETAAAVGRDALGGRMEPSQAAAADLSRRQQVRRHLLQGDVDGAMALAEEVAPGALGGGRRRLRFQLLCQRFAEMVQRKQEMAGLEYARAVVCPACTSREEWGLLQDALALTAYEDPASSPSGYLLSEAHRAELAAEVDRAILGAKGMREDSALERLFKQAVAVRGELVACEDPAASLLEVQAVIDSGSCS